MMFRSIIITNVDMYMVIIMMIINTFHILIMAIITINGDDYNDNDDSNNSL